MLRVAELPAAFAVASRECNDAELEGEFWDALTDVLRSYLHFGDSLPLPAEVTSLPWQASRPHVPVQYVAPLGGGAAHPASSFTATIGNVKQDELVAA